MAGNGHLTGTFKVNSGMAQMLRGRVIMDVVNAEQGKIAEVAGAVVVMALESSGGVWDYSLSRKSIAWIM
jgi:pyridoxal 5'-phosphate synthase pdxS subunit